MGKVVAVSASPRHTFTKQNRDSIILIEGQGVQGDAHAGSLAKNLKGALVANLRQVHLIHSELFAEMASLGYDLKPGDIGENITTEGVDLMSQPEHTRVHIGEACIVELKGLRAPCSQLNKFAEGLKSAMLFRDGEGKMRVKTGVLGVVIAGGEIRPGDPIRVEPPAGETFPLEPI